MNNLEIFGAKEHNLKNIDLTLPRNQLIVITGVSGSGKSSLAFDTIYAEGQRRYMEAFSMFAQRMMGNIRRPNVDKIDGLSPVVSIEQKTVSKNPRSTVGTITEVYDFMRLLFAKIADAYSYISGQKMQKSTDDQIVELILKKFDNLNVIFLAPVVKGRKGHYRELFEQLSKSFVRVCVDGVIRDLTPKMQLDKFKAHDIEVVIDAIKIDEKNRQRVQETVKRALDMGKNTMLIMLEKEKRTFFFSRNLTCPTSFISYDDPSPNTFSFNTKYGQCPYCKGIGFVLTPDIDAIIPDRSININDGAFAPLGEAREIGMFELMKRILRKKGYTLKTPIQDIDQNTLKILLYGEKDKFSELGEDIDSPIWLSMAIYLEVFPGIINYIYYQYRFGSVSAQERMEQYFRESECSECKGGRLKKESLHFKILDKNIYDLAKMPISSLKEWFLELPKHLDERKNLIAKDILKEINNRLMVLDEIGLGYLDLNRGAKTLSGGEAQRVRLATQIGSQLVGVTYILDEPSIGLHQRDNHKLIKSLKNLRDLGNTVIVVEHDREMIEQADYVLDIGPGAGVYGGTVVAEGKPDRIIEQNTETSQFLRREKDIFVPKIRRQGKGQYLTLIGASGNNLKNITVKFPLGKLIVVTGVSGSGKSTLISETLAPILKTHYSKEITYKSLPYKKIEGLEYIDKVIEIDQSPIGRTPRSNPATYTGVFTFIRDLFAQLPEAKIRGYKQGRFSFNVKGGRCETCKGGGEQVIEMGFLPDVSVTCETCKGKRYNRETLEVRYKGKSISDVLSMTVEEAIHFFDAHPRILKYLHAINDVGLNYMTLGQSSVTVSGGEAQRIKLATELVKRDTGNTFYILDEPTTGLHFSDVKKLTDVLQRLVDKGNTVLVVEHNLDVIKVADHIIDLGPEGGEKGGYIVAEGTPEEIITVPHSITGQFLKKELELTPKA
ncbi:MAG: excinuclease ABC subunit UvrA [Bacteroidia bacterium]|nr:excinuclease ABC subunit UvrA [Bacteroidia bacterium]MDW8347216.1 excinuclease ABC subunit UvrA [Bacteroidia bacterium]